MTGGALLFNPDTVESAAVGQFRGPRALYDTKQIEPLTCGLRIGQRVIYSIPWRATERTGKPFLFHSVYSVWLLLSVLAVKWSLSKHASSAGPSQTHKGQHLPIN